jgi:microcystin-dependent protein
VGTGLITSAAYNAATNVLTLTTANGDVIPISMTALLADAVATGLITSSSYVAATNILTLTTANGDNIAIDMTAILADAVATALIPAGNIMMRADNTVPSGWALCDGTSGTPDLRDRFVIGASGTLPVGTAGGSATHTHAATTTGSTTLTEAMTPPHNHHIVAAGTNTGVPTGNAAIAEASASGGDSEYSLDIGFGSASLGLSSTPVDSTGAAIAAVGHTHTTPALAITQLPPHYALIFIMKL